MKYELSEQQVSSLLQLISNADIKGRDAAIVIGLVNTLRSPLPKETKKKDKKEE